MGFFKLLVKAFRAVLFFKTKSDTIVNTAVKIAQTVETAESTRKLAKDIAKQAEQLAEDEINREVAEAAQKTVEFAKAKIEQVETVVEKKLSSGMSEYIPHNNDDLKDLLKAATKKS